MSIDGLKKVVPISIVLGVAIGGACLFLMGCSALGLGGGEPAAPASSTWQEGIVTAVSTANPGVGAILGGLFAGYQLIRKRSRERWVSATKNVVTGRLNDAVQDIDKALGGGHTSKAPRAR